MTGEQPIGVFDSGVGGLTVLRALIDRLPREDFWYLGDTARLPYGTKSPETVARYARQAAHVLVDRGIKMLVVACNTASAVALDALRQEFPNVQVVGVVEPGAAAACAASPTGHIAVIGTEGTIRGEAYTRAILRHRPDATVIGRPCPLFVALAEEGWTDGPVPVEVARRYLGDLVARVDTLVLGCTHFPLLAGAIATVTGSEISMVDSAATTASTVAGLLAHSGAETSRSSTGAIKLLATDSRDRFARVGRRFLGEDASLDGVELVDL